LQKALEAAGGGVQPHAIVGSSDSITADLPWATVDVDAR
jgi:hypothetical protein